MHLVFVSSLLPVAHPVSGFDIANRVIVDALNAQGVEVSLLGCKSPGAELSDPERSTVLAELELTNANASSFSKVSWLVKALTNGTTVSSAKMLGCGRDSIVSALENLAPFDGLILNSVQLPGAFLTEFAAHDFIFVAHNVEAQSAMENAENSDRWIEQRLFQREARLLGKLEQELCLRSRFVWTLADGDRAALRVDDDNLSTVLPLVTSIEPPAVSSQTNSIDYDLGMIGTWSWKPNRVGLDWFLNEVTPHLANDLTIAIAGNLPDPPGSFAHQGIKLLGRVPDARDFLRHCAVVPLASTAGTGVQLKTIETFEMGLPCVATPTALRGVSTPPENCAVERDPVAFADALTKAVGAARQFPDATRDGRAFHHNQIERLNEALTRGLVRLDQSRIDD